MNKENGNRALAFMLLYIIASWTVGLVLIPLRYAGIVHMAKWINISFFWSPYLILSFAFVGTLAYELRAEEKKRKEGGRP